MTRAEFAKMVDHTALKPNTTREEILQLCHEACEYGLGAVCIAPAWISLAVDTLAGTPVRIATVIGFPHGNTFRSVKAIEANQAIEAGAQELDMVIHVGALKSGLHQKVFEDIRSVVDTARRKPGTLVKVILETCSLSDDEKVLGCQLIERAGADFVKTSTGFAAAGATIEDVALLRSVVSDRLEVKAAGGIRDLCTALAMIEAGATRLGCSSSVAIMKEFPVDSIGS